MTLTYRDDPDIEAVLDLLGELCDCPHEPCRIFRRDCDTCLDNALVKLVDMTKDRMLAMLEEKREGIGDVREGFAGALLSDVMRWVREL